MFLSELSPLKILKSSKDIYSLLIERIYCNLQSGKLKININGHFKQKNLFIKNLFCSLSFIDNNNEKDLQALYHSLLSGSSLNEFIFCGEDYHICPECGDKIKWECNGVELRAVGACEYPWGSPAYEILINIPSGKMVIEDDLRVFFDMNLDLSCNSDKFISKTYETVGLAHGYIGNTNPNIFQNDGCIILGNKEKNLGKIIGKIKTDLWWYSIADYDTIMSRADNKLEFQNVLIVEPGVYSISHRSHIDDDVFAIIKKLD